MKLLQQGWIVSLILVISLSACAGSAKVLPLASSPDPQGRFEFSIPTTWQQQTEDDINIYASSISSGGDESLRVLLFLAPTNTLDVQQHIDAAEPMIQGFLSRYIDESYEIVSQEETKVDKHAAMLINFAKPKQESYILGQVVIAAMSGVVVIFLGTGSRTEWDAFLPTFNAMLKSFHLISAFTPTPPES